MLNLPDWSTASCRVSIDTKTGPIDTSIDTTASNRDGRDRHIATPVGGTPPLARGAYGSPCTRFRTATEQISVEIDAQLRRTTLKGLVPLPSPTASAFRPPRSAPLSIPASQSIIRLSTTTRSATSNQTNRPTSPSASHHTTARTATLHPKGRLKYLSIRDSAAPPAR